MVSSHASYCLGEGFGAASIFGCILVHDRGCNGRMFPSAQRRSRAAGNIP